MKTKSLLFLTLLHAATAPAALIVTEVMSSSSHPGGTSNADWFEVTNNASTALDITGWTWDDDTTTAQLGNFGSITSIAAGESLVLTGETAGAEAAFKSDWNMSASVRVINLGTTVFQSFSSTGDQIRIYNASSTLLSTLTFGTATTGTSFEYDINGASLGLSVIGENGAYQATSNGAGAAGTDIGSPGAVPEPSTWVMLVSGVGMFLLVSSRKRLA